MQLTGMPINMKTVLEVEEALTQDYNNALKTIADSKVIKDFTRLLNEEWVEKQNQILKKKRVTLADAKEQFNPNSGIQLQKLLLSFWSYLCWV